MTHCLQSILANSRLYSAATLARVTIVYSQLRLSSLAKSEPGEGAGKIPIRGELCTDECVSC